ncbi:MAG: hypothetical protein AAFW73_23060, partial [Bacteroidota bacterium]
MKTVLSLRSIPFTWSTMLRIGCLWGSLLYAVGLQANSPTYDQLPLTWDGGFLSNEVVLPDQASALEFSYLGQMATIGYWDADDAAATVPLFSLQLASNGDAILSQNGTAINFLPGALANGDVVTLERRLSGTFAFLINDQITVSPLNTDLSKRLQIYFQDGSGIQTDQLALYVSDLATYPAEWESVSTTTNGNHHVATAELGRGQDGYGEYVYNGASRVDFGFYRGKLPEPSHAIARLLYKSSNHRLSFYINGNSVAHHTLTLSSDDLLRIERKASTIVFYAPGLELAYTVDGNQSLHPSLKKTSGIQPDQVRLSFVRKGGGCPDYFGYTTSAYSHDPSPYYPAASAERSSHNYVHSTIYDGRGEGPCHILSEQRAYTDDLGRPTQQQSKDYLTGKVWATETLYDVQGRVALATLAAPTGKNYIEYREHFVQDQGGSDYGVGNFDLSAKLNNPDPIGPQVNSLGWWYSSYNTEEPWQAVTDYPYTRTEYSSLTGAARRTAAPGDAYRMGGGHETVSYSMQALQEVDYLFRKRDPLCLLAGSSYDENGLLSAQCSGNSERRYTKQISVDPDGKELIVFYDLYGNEVARALSGKVAGENVHTQAVSAAVAPGGYRDLHLTDASSSITFSSADLRYEVYDLATDQLWFESPASGNDQVSISLPPGFYRVVSLASNAILTVSYTLNYHNFSLYLYDKSGQMIATVAPNDLRHSTNANHDHHAFSYYRYNTQGELVWEETPDAGRTEYHYRQDGQIRFSQNALQLAAGRFSYSKYDDLGRVVEMGECSSLPADLDDPTLLEDADYPSSGTSQVMYQVYSQPVTGSGRSQQFLRGKLSHSYNDDSKLWYSYDEQGRMSWMAHQITGSGTKITDYRYDLVGNVTEVVYEAGGLGDEFHHHYTYDANGQLTSVSTQHNDQVSIPADVHAQYRYTPSGALAQRDIAEGLELQEFAYTLQGQLKAINPLDMAEASTSVGGNHTFSMALDYYEGDYEAANGQLGGRTADLFGSGKAEANYSGNLAAQRWKTRANVGTADLSGHFVYAYSYNHRNELLTARFGQVLATANPAFTGTYSQLADYFVNIGGYDLNGNFKQSFIRRGPANGKMDKLRYRYDKTGGKNRLTHIDDVWADFPGVDDLTDQAPNNYVYDARGQLVEDIQADLRLEYDVYGKVKKVYERSTNDLKVTYLYDVTGQRVGKEVPTGNPGEVLKTYYARAIGGQLQAIYEVLVSSSPGGQGTGSGSSGNGGVQLKELSIYGAGRLGVARYDGTLFGYEYQLSDHLGNVRAVITR